MSDDIFEALVHSGKPEPQKPERVKLTGQMPATVAAKWREDLLDEGFTPFPKRLIRCAKDIFTGPHAIELLAVALAIVDYRRPGIVRAPSAGLLAFTAGMGTEEFLDRLDELERAGLAKSNGSANALDVDLEGLYRAVREKSDEG